MCKTEEIYKVKDKELTYSTYFAWLVLNTPEEYKRVVAKHWTYGDSPCSNDIIVKMLFTAEHIYLDKKLACVQDVETKRVYIIDCSVLELKEDKEKEEKSFLDRLRKNERNFLQGLATGKRHCDTRECCNCILSFFPETSCEKLAKDLLEKLK
jgi:hypothetical protein